MSAPSVLRSSPPGSMLETQRKEAREYSTDKFRWARFDENTAVFASDLGEVKVKLPYDPKQKLCYHIRIFCRDIHSFKWI